MNITNTVKLQNLGSNKHAVIIEALDFYVKLYFSYETVVAFNYLGNTVVRENEWGKTTGKFLNELQPDKKLRVSSEYFESELERILNG